MEKAPLSLPVSNSLSLPLFVVGHFVLRPRGHAALDNDSEITSDSAMTHNLHGEVRVPICVRLCVAQSKQTYVDSPFIGWASSALIVLSRQTQVCFWRVGVPKRWLILDTAGKIAPSSRKHILRDSIMYCATWVPPTITSTASLATDDVALAP